MTGAYLEAALDEANEVLVLNEAEYGSLYKALRIAQLCMNLLYNTRQHRYSHDAGVHSSYRYAATTHNTRLEMKRAKMNDVCLLMKCDIILWHTSVNW